MYIKQRHLAIIPYNYSHPHIHSHTRTRTYTHTAIWLPSRKSRQTLYTSNQTSNPQTLATMSDSFSNMNSQMSKTLPKERRWKCCKDMVKNILSDKKCKKCSHAKCGSCIVDSLE